MNLSREDVAELLALLDGLPYDELDLETPAFRLTLRRDGGAGWSQELDIRGEPKVEDDPDEASGGDGPGAPAFNQPPEPTGSTEDRVRPDGAVAVRSPIVGTFYRAPRPGAAPFVEVGDHVDETTVVGLVETMKLFNSIEAGVRGAVLEILADDGEAVARGQALLYVEAAAG